MTPPDGAAPSRSPLDHPAVTAVVDQLRASGATGEVRAMPESARTAKQAADGLGCEVGAIASSLVFDAAGVPVLVLTSGAHRVNTDKVAATIGVPRLGRATPDFVRSHTGQTIGGVAPVGHPRRLDTYLDTALAAYDVLWASAGHGHVVFATTYDELLRITGATEIDVT